MQVLSKYMKIYSLKRLQMLPTDVEGAWRFFSDPKNLGRITPPSMNFRTMYQSGGEEMYAGQIIRYKVTVFPNVTVDWLTEITHVQRPHYFVDEQRIGPYALWHHQHHFREKQGETEMTDEVNYAIPYGPIGRLANHVLVQQQLKRIFDYRASILREAFAKDLFTKDLNRRP
jgi:ligand-binding SRPBCC domain-containing protein